MATLALGHRGSLLGSATLRRTRLMMASPFGQYAGIVALIVGIGVIAAWLASLVGIVPTNPTLDAIAYVIIGVIFGTSAGANFVVNGVERKADVANTRLDAIQAPPAPVAEAIVAHQSPSPAIPPTDSPTP